MATEPITDPAQQAILAKVESSFKRYAFIFTALGTLFTIANVAQQIYFRSLDRATLLSRDPALIERQLVLRKASEGGKNYRVESKSDDEFTLSLIVLLNYYETTAEMINHWIVIGPVVRSSIACPLDKHVRIFLLGESKAGYWTTNGAFFKPEQFPATMTLYEVTKSREKECEPEWR